MQVDLMADLPVVAEITEFKNAKAHTDKATRKISQLLVLLKIDSEEFATGVGH
jgi:hypothetical protein